LANVLAAGDRSRQQHRSANKRTSEQKCLPPTKFFGEDHNRTAAAALFAVLSTGVFVTSAQDLKAEKIFGVALQQKQLFIKEREELEQVFQKFRAAQADAQVPEEPPVPVQGRDRLPVRNFDG
jgi:hypothetical protein